MSFGERLKCVREKMGLSLEKFSLLGGVQARTQIYYEKSERYPTVEYLAKLADAGIDIPYLITGIMPDNHPVDDSERELLKAYRSASKDKKNALLLIARSPEISQKDDNQDGSGDGKSGALNIKKKSKLDNKQTLFSLYRWNDMKMRTILLAKLLPVVLLSAVFVVLFSYAITEGDFIENIYLQIASFILFSLLLMSLTFKYLDGMINSYESNVMRSNYFQQIFVS